MNTAIVENEMITRLARGFRRSPDQLNKLNESDAEIVRLGESGILLAITTDSIVEEIAAGLYEDPYLIGWMAAIVNFSDLAAVGAAPAGLLISETLPHGLSDGFIDAMQKGIEDGCRDCGTFTLGGDTNAGDRLQVTGCAVGIIEGSRPMSRVGCHPGDLLYSSGPLGSGNAYAIVRFVHAGANPIYMPHARTREGRILRGIAGACMDTSDGVLATLDQLMRLNNVGFRLDSSWECALAPDACAAASDAQIPPWLLLAGLHGEFELLFTVAPALESMLLARAEASGWMPHKIGAVIVEPFVEIAIRGRATVLDTARIRNAGFRGGDNVRGYIEELMSIDEELQKGKIHHGR